MTTAYDIIKILSSRCLPLQNEKELQREIADLFDEAGVRYEREVPVSGGIIDFCVGPIGIEVKIKGQKRAIFHQVSGYAEDPGIEEIILATGLAMRLPDEINGKRAHVVSLGKAWL